MTDNNEFLELEQMRSQMNELKTMLKEQTIVNEKMMRRVMRGKYNKVRNDIRFSIVFALVAMPLTLFVLVSIRMPMWFSVVTVAFLLTAFCASVYALRFVSDDMMAGNLTSVAIHMVQYKRFGVRWLSFGIPFLVLWMCTFFYLISLEADGEYLHGIICGGIVGALIGCILGAVNYIQNLRRMNSIIRDIKELKGKR